MRLLEKQIEDVFEQFYEELIEPELKLKGRQVTLKNKRRVDLLFTDKNNRDVILELKKEKVKDKDVGQIVSYAGTLNDSRIILAAPKIDKSYKNSFEHYGIEYIEFSITKIQKLFSRLSKMKDDNYTKVESIAVNEIIKEPLSQKKIIDGNIAFKVSYNDKNWSGICSPEIYHENSFGKHKMYWCAEQHKENSDYICQDWNDNQLDTDNFPCYDCVANKILGFGPGWNHGQDKPHVCLNAKVKKIAFLTSLEPGKAQSERFIFTIFQIDKIKRRGNNGLEYYYGNHSTAIKLNPNQYLKFWNYYENSSSSNKFKNFWGSGLFRYINDKVAIEILSDIIKRHGFTKKQKSNAEILLNTLINE